MRRLAATLRIGLSFAIVLLSAIPSEGSPAEDERVGELRIVAPRDGATLPLKEAILRWSSVGSGTVYIVGMAPTPFDVSMGPSAVEDRGGFLGRTRKNWYPAGRFGGQSIRGEWHWAVWSERAGTVLPSELRSIHFLDAGREAPEIVRTGVARFTPSEVQSSSIRFSGGTVLAQPVFSSPADSASPYRLVHFRGVIREEWRSALEDAGAEVFDYLPGNAFLVRIKGQPESRLDGLPGVDWVSTVPAESKISRRAAPIRSKTTGEYAILLHRGEKTAPVREFLSSVGATPTRVGDGILFAIGDRSAVDTIASLPAVRWIEPTVPLELHNSDCQWVVQSDQSGVRSIWDRGIRGANILLAMCDSGVRTSHDMFIDPLHVIAGFGDYPDHRKLVAYRKADSTSAIVFGDDPGASWHGTHTACTAVGDDSSHGGSGADGIAPQVKLFFVDGGGTSNSIYMPPDLGTMLETVYTGNNAGAPRVMSNSWGSANGGAYDFRCEQVDRFVWEHDDFLLVFSNGNSTMTGSVGSPATSKNCISAGGTENGSSADQLYAATSRGPTDDGRMKPTICAPARLLSASGENDGSYQTLHGTSMATPAIASAAALVRQYFLDGYYPTGTEQGSPPHDPSAALVKALLVAAGGDDIAGHQIPSNDIGWGRLNLEKALYFPGDMVRLGVIDERTGLLTGDVATYEFTVASSSTPLEIVLVWNDYPSTPAAAIHLVNNLDLEVTGGGASYRGNVFSGGASTTGGVSDDRNVEEVVLVPAPIPGVWTVRVAGSSIPFGPQPFALAVTGDLDADAAAAHLDRSSYGGADTVFVRVEDGNATGPVAVSIHSDSESLPETVILAGSGGIFSGSVPTAAVLPAPGDGILSVSHGDSIVLTYFDDGSVEKRDVAVAWLAGPVIHPPEGTADGSLATIRWSTEDPSDSRVAFGTVPGVLTDTVFAPELVTDHRVALPGLLPETTYYLEIASGDHRGNVTTDDGGAERYRVTTDPGADVLLVIGDGTFEREDHYRNAFDRHQWNAAITTGAIPSVGNKLSGMRSHAAVIWQPGWEQYPPVPATARDSLTKYLNGGGRLLFVSHDVAWAFGEPASGFHSAETEAWLANALKIDYQNDPSSWNIAFGYPGDPISGSYAAGVFYTPFRSGGAGDEVAPASAFGGTIDPVWKNNWSYSPVALRWTEPVASGSPDSAAWGGTPTKGVTYTFEWAQLNAAIADDAHRAAILDKTLQWLIGRDHPEVALATFADGGTISSAPASIEWWETKPGGVGTRRIEWSGDGGASWNLIEPAAGASPYSWDLAGVPNGTRVRIRVTLIDAGTPSLMGRATSSGDITILIPGNDSRGPRMVAGSGMIVPNPAPQGSPIIVTAMISDSTRGATAVIAAEWSLGPTPAGSGTPMEGIWGGLSAAVFDTIAGGILTPPADTIWIRGKDAGGNWGEAHPLPASLAGNYTAVADGAPPRSFQLHGNSPNPFNPVTTIRFDLPIAGAVRGSIYTIGGRLVRRLVDERLPAGSHAVNWNGVDDTGRDTGSGIYLLRVETEEEFATRKMMLIR